MARRDRENMPDAVHAAAKAGERDRYLAALLSPGEARGDLMALSAYVAEVGQIANEVSDAPLAEIKLQWWRDALSRFEAGEKSGNPVADEFGRVVAARNLPRAKLEDWFDAHVHTFYAESPASESTLFLEMTLLQGIPFAFAQRILGETGCIEDQDLVADAAIAYGLARLGLEYPRALARGRTPLPQPAESSGAKAYIVSVARERLGRVKSAFAHATHAQKQALLPLALVEPYLQALERDDHDLKRHIGDIAPLSRVWRIWRASRGGKI